MAPLNPLHLNRIAPSRLLLGSQLPWHAHVIVGAEGNRRRALIRLLGGARTRSGTHGESIAVLFCCDCSRPVLARTRGKSRAELLGTLKVSCCWGRDARSCSGAAAPPSEPNPLTCTPAFGSTGSAPARRITAEQIGPRRLRE